MTTYTTQQVQAGIKFLQNANVNLDVEYDGDERQVHLHIHTPQGTRFWTSGDSIWSKQKVKKGVLIEGIGMCATYTDYEEDNYWSGGLAGNINYDGSGKDGTWFDGGSMTMEDKQKQGSMLINPVKLEDSDGLIYTDYGFIENAFKYGATKEEIMEVFQLTSVLGMHTCTVGVPILIEEMRKANIEF